MIAKTFFAFIATLCFSVIFNIDKKQLLFCGIIGAMGWFTYTLCLKYSLSAISATFIATLIVTSMSRILSNLRKNPITIFLIPGIIPLVPGSGLYYTMYNLVKSKNIDASIIGIETIKLSGSIAIGIIIILTLPSWIFIKHIKKMHS